MKHSLFAGPAKLALSLGALALPLFAHLSAAQAQPDLNNAPKATNPTNRPVGRPLTPQERVQQRLRQQLRLLGVNELAVQDALLDYVGAETAARQALSEKGLRLQTGLRGNALSDAQVAALLNDYQAAVEEDKARQAKAQAELAKKVDLTRLPKVEAILVLMGFYGDGPVLLNSLNLNVRGRQTARAADTPAAQAAPAGFGVVAPTATRPRATQPNIKPPAPTPAAQ